MGTTVHQIRQWLEQGKRDGKSHVLIVCDTFDWDDFPVFVDAGQNPRIVAREWSDEEDFKLMEVYDLSMDFEEQLVPYVNVFNWGESWPPIPEDGGPA